MTSMNISSTVKSLAEAAFSRTKAVASPPQVASADATSVAVDKGQELDPTSDAALSLSSSFPSLASFKDQRTFEHDRQRTKHLEDYTKMREAKAAKASPWLSVREKRDASANSLTRRERRIGSSASDEEVYVHDALEGVRGPVMRKQLSGAATLKSEVTLADLIKPSSIRKSRKNKDTDFEVVPALRPVIVLDELAFMHDTPAPRDLEQEWQHVYHSDGDDSDSSVIIPTPTYANVLVGGLN